MIKYYRNCRICNKEIIYKTLRGLKISFTRNLLGPKCKFCNYEKCRNCIECKKTITYHTKGSYDESIKKHPNGVMCYKCNPIKSSINRDYSRWRTDKFRTKMSSITSGKQNGMYGKNVYNVWVKKYGKGEADRRDTVRRKKWSKALSGKNNPMYGKPSPKKSGKGFSGWYNKIFFRSLRELKYLLYMEQCGIKWENAEKAKYAVEYKGFNGQDRVYYPDFILPELKLVIECKPKRLCQTPLNKLKKLAAIKHFKRIGFAYKMLDPGIVEIDELKQLINSGKVKMLKDISKWLKD